MASPTMPSETNVVMIRNDCRLLCCLLRPQRPIGNSPTNAKQSCFRDSRDTGFIIYNTVITAFVSQLSIGNRQSQCIRRANISAALQRIGIADLIPCRRRRRRGNHFNGKYGRSAGCHHLVIRIGSNNRPGNLRPELPDKSLTNGAVIQNRINAPVIRLILLSSGKRE